jgi:hypothetical protein
MPAPAGVRRELVKPLLQVSMMRPAFTLLAPSAFDTIGYLVSCTPPCPATPRASID